MPRPRKATVAEIRAYETSVPRPLYPLAYWVKASSTKGARYCPVEGLYEEDGPKYEVRAPKGWHFRDGYDKLHGLLCFTLQDVATRVDGERLEPCDHSCV